MTDEELLNKLNQLCATLISYNYFDGSSIDVDAIKIEIEKRLRKLKNVGNNYPKDKGEIK